MSQEDKDKLMEARCRLMVRDPFYGSIAMSIEWKASDMNWIEKDENKKLGVRIIDGGKVQCLYYPPYVRTKNLKQLYGAVQHVIEHLMRLHPVRRGSREGLFWDMACDYCVNGKKNSPRIGYKESSRAVSLPGDKMLWCPNDWDENDPAEAHYKKLRQNHDEVPSGDDLNNILAAMVDDHTIWAQSDVSEDEARQIVYDMATEAANKAQGSVPGHVTELLKALAKPKVRWRELLRRLIGTYVGSKRKTYSRRNRKYRIFGLPGYSRHAASRVSVVVDTSGSVNQKMLQQFFAEIEMVTHRAEVHLLQWDHAFQGYSKYRRNDWKKIKVRGRGGTDMAAPVEWLLENGCYGDCMIMLTDGICNWPEIKKLNAIFVISGKGNRGYNGGPNWGRVVEIEED